MDMLFQKLSYDVLYRHL